MNTLEEPVMSLFDALGLVGHASDATALTAILRALEETDHGCDDERHLAIQAALWRMHKR